MQVVHNKKTTESEVSDLLKRVGPSPTHLTSNQKKCYQTAGKILIRSGRLKEIYLPALEILAVNIAMYQDAVVMINSANKEDKNSGYIQTFKNEVKQISPYVTLKKDAEASIMRCLKQFGMDPKSDKELGQDTSGQLSLFDQINKSLQQSS